ncbi:MAG: hypothetical protein FWF03_08050, partial [Defluviitaleaceae bacterium]|nr:hypothetical protein [Defluviitaleaceae bacterium]
ILAASVSILTIAPIAMFGCGGNSNEPAAPTQPPATPTSAPFDETDDDFAADVEFEDIAADFEEEDIAAEVPYDPNIILQLIPNLYEDTLYPLAIARVENDWDGGGTNLDVLRDEDEYYTPPASLRVYGYEERSPHMMLDIADEIHPLGPGLYYIEAYVLPDIDQPVHARFILGSFSSTNWVWIEGNTKVIEPGKYNKLATLMHINWQGRLGPQGWLYLMQGAPGYWIDDLKIYKLDMDPETDYIINKFNFDFGIDQETLDIDNAIEKDDAVRLFRMPRHRANVGYLKYPIADILNEHGHGDYYIDASMFSNSENPVAAEISIFIEDDAGPNNNPIPLILPDTREAYMNLTFKWYGDILSLKWEGEVKEAFIIIRTTGDNEGDPFWITDMRLAKMNYDFAKPPQ